MSFLNDLNPVGAITKAVFGDKGLAGGVTDVLERAGVLKNLTPEEQQKADDALRQYELEVMDKDNASINYINQSIQAEAKSEHFMQYAWRPTVGFVFAAILVNNYIIVPYISQAKMLDIPGQVWSAILVILGAASAGRSWEKVTKTKGQTPTAPSNPANNAVG